MTNNRIKQIYTMIVAVIIVAIQISLCTAARLRGTNIVLAQTIKKQNELKRVLLENIDGYLYDNNDKHKVQYDHHNDLNMLSLLNTFIHKPTDRIAVDIYALPQIYSDDYVGMLEGLLPTETVYHNDHFFLNMDFREHRYEEVNLDVFNYIHDIDLISQVSQEVDNTDLSSLFDTRKIIGLMGHLPGKQAFESFNNEVVEPKIAFESASVFSYLDKGTKVLDRFASEAYSPPPDVVSIDDWVGQLHGLLSGGTVYHNQNFHLSFDAVEHQYQTFEHSIIDIINKISSGDKITSDAFKPASINGDGKLIMGLLGLLPGSTTSDYMLRQDDAITNLEPQQSTLSFTTLVLDKMSTSDLVHPVAYSGPLLIERDGDYVGQLHGLFPDLDNKMKYTWYSLDEQIGSGEGDDVAAGFVDLFGKFTESNTNGANVHAADSGHDVLAYLMTYSPTMAPSISPSASPSASLSPTSSMTEVVCGASYGNCIVESSLHAVRCCSEYEIEGWAKNSGCNVWAESDIGGVCYALETLSSANNICAAVGARLCTQSELEGDCAAGTGCEFDHEFAWTSDRPDVELVS